MFRDSKYFTFSYLRSWTNRTYNIIIESARAPRTAAFRYFQFPKSLYKIINTGHTVSSKLTLICLWSCARDKSTTLAMERSGRHTDGHLLHSFENQISIFDPKPIPVDWLTPSDCFTFSSPTDPFTTFCNFEFRRTTYINYIKFADPWF